MTAPTSREDIRPEDCPGHECEPYPTEMIVVTEEQVKAEPMRQNWSPPRFVPCIHCGAPVDRGRYDRRISHPREAELLRAIPANEGTPMTIQPENHSITLALPSNINIGDLITARGAIFDASTSFVDWCGLYEGKENAIDPVGKLLLAIAHALQDAS